MLEFIQFLQYQEISWGSIVIPVQITLQHFDKFDKYLDK